MRRKDEKNKIQKNTKHYTLKDKNCVRGDKSDVIRNKRISVLKDKRRIKGRKGK